jgi:hypothetical protein
VVLTLNQPLNRVYINDFIKRFYNPLFGNDATTKSRNKFALDLLDLDYDGNVSPKDLVALDDLVDIHSKVGQELELIKAYYVHILH